MIDQLPSEPLRAAFLALRTAIARRQHADAGPAQAALRALDGLEQAALNAPQNRGWLRKRQIELREALNACVPNSLARSDTDELHLLYRDIVAILHLEPIQRHR